jgi:hypothetical protein
MYQQRGEQAAETREVVGVWRPAPEGEGLAPEPDADDRNGVVDDLEADHVILVLDQWPTVDGTGHLVFSGDPVIRYFPVGDFQRLVDDRRERAGQPAADRALRVGDVFWIRPGEDTRLKVPRQWQLRDVTAQARRAARAAQMVAVNPAMREPVADAGRAAADTAQGQGRRPATGSASPAV